VSTSLAPILQYFFTEHLVSHKQVSPQTIVAYRDSFRLLLKFLKKRTGKQPSTLCVDDLDAPAIVDFLDSLEEQRGNQVCSRNARLTAIRSFFHVVAFRDPESIGIVGRVLAIPKKRTDKRLVGYLTRDEMEAVLTAPDQSTWIGRRDHALLLTMYNSGARLSEMTCMQRDQVKFDSTTYLQLHGKGRKERVVPLWAKTGRVLRTGLRMKARSSVPPNILLFAPRYFTPSFTNSGPPTRMRGRKLDSSRWSQCRKESICGDGRYRVSQLPLGPPFPRARAVARCNRTFRFAHQCRMCLEALGNLD